MRAVERNDCDVRLRAFNEETRLSVKAERLCAARCRSLKRDFCAQHLRRTFLSPLRRESSVAKRASSRMSHVLLLATESLPKPTVMPLSTKAAKGARP